ncbi:FtsB family cell division protein [Ectobacillus panaciterrae]|uniref:FtsB family cell division protein n=1 Tax=Ectobacillus panaciterrae TaxID=363872 RepID=UPI0003FDACAF|nr:septum formation initiator family protein [Ectobacillus panaciterrae]
MRELKKYVRENPTSSPQHTLPTENKSKKRLLRRLTLFLTFALTVVISLNITFYKQKANIKKQQAQIQELKRELGTLSAEQKKLNGQVQNLNDDEYIAKIARRDYFFSKPGEVIIPISK